MRKVFSGLQIAGHRNVAEKLVMGKDVLKNFLPKNGQKINAGKEDE